MRRKTAVFWQLTALAALFFLLAGCQSAYYNTMEKMGRHKRDILVDRVEKARDAQQEAKEQFRSALERFGSVVAYDGGGLEEKYTLLQAEFDRCSERAEAVEDRIEAVEEVADALFAEWKTEIKDYSNPALRAESARSLEETRGRYGRLIAAMRRAEARIEPVLDAFRDQVLFLKHNLNARAVAALQNELVSMETDIGQLIREMEYSIAEAETFLQAMQQR